MSKFKVGDIIRANEKSDKEYAGTNHKNGWTGKILTIEAGLIYAETITPTCNRGVGYHVTEEFFDLVSNNQIQKHILGNKNTVVIILDDGRKGVAKCNPTDKFNPAFGTALAVARAYGDKETEAKLLAEPVNI